jgi:DNA-binding MarR family transcriptional regulator/ribosomal protein S18 acetylase RimI-like enzyme
MMSGAEIYKSSGIEFEPRWFPVYRLLADRGPTTVGECARELGLTHSAVSPTARAMAKRGILSSRRDAADERRRLLELTDEGTALLPRLRELWHDIEAGVLDAVDYGGVDILAAIEGVEQAFAVHSLSERVATHTRARMMGAVEIVDFCPEYREYFKTLNLEWLEKYFSVEPVDREVLWNPESILDDGGAILFARVDDEIVGTCALQKQGDNWELTKMAVTERHQGKQIGKKLMLAIVERARAMGLERLYLVTNSSLTPAVTLYRKAGFRVTRCGQHPKYERGDLTMELDLENAA